YRWLALSWSPATDGSGPSFKMLKAPSIIELTLTHGDQIDRQWFERFPSANGYAVPYAWGTLGVVYRKDLISEPIISWQQLFQPNKQLSGHIGMLSTPRDLVGMALKALGNSANAENKHQLREARDLIKQQAQHVSTYNYLSTRENSEIIRGNVRAAMISNGDALKLRRINPDLEFVLPVEGGNLRIDYLAIPLHAKNPSLAIQFIDFITTAEYAAQQASYSFYAPIHQAARGLLPEQFLKDSKIFPQSANLKNSEVYRHSSPMTMKYKNETLAQIHQ
ncbi:MAG: spermidine/putrescine ABC transporter substrate-binding protein, partial [Motiliproteus sp.]|nr:spermidine/putrescine ABC transporter substrate-binding protein [Motiliproteus sp.]